MTTIRANFAAMDTGHTDLVACWRRIEQHLGDLDSAVSATHDMSAEMLTAYQGLKSKWTTSAQDRQVMLQSLADAVDRARQGYQDIDARLAAQFQC